MGAFPSSGFIPTKQTPYMLQGLFSEPKLAMLIESGILDFGTLAVEVKSGDYVSIPAMVQAADFSHVDLTDTSAASGTRISSDLGKAVVLHDASINTWTKHDEMRSGENFRNLLAQTAGNKMAKRILRQLNNHLKGVLNVTSGATSHLLDKTAVSTGIVVQNIRQAKALAGDVADQLDTMIIHSKVLQDLIYDLTYNYKYSGNISADWLMNGGANALFGVSKIIVSDDLVADTGAVTASTGDDQYYTYICAPGSIWMGYQEVPSYEEFIDARIPSTLNYGKWGMDYTIAARGFAWNSTGNPTDANYALYSNYTVAYEDHRNFKVVAIKSLGGKQ